MSIKKSAGLVLVGCLLMSGCVTRSLTIKTNPAEAIVYVNDQLKGNSPVTYDFSWYGWHRVMIRKEGFQRVDDRKMLRAPVYLWIPFDLIMELLPFRIHDGRVWEYTLIPQREQTPPMPPELFKKPASLTDYSVKPKPAQAITPPPVREVPAPAQEPLASVEVKAEVSTSAPDATGIATPPADKE